jgi:hypothetical protein
MWNETCNALCVETNQNAKTLPSLFKILNKGAKFILKCKDHSYPTQYILLPVLNLHCQTILSQQPCLEGHSSHLSICMKNRFTTSDLILFSFNFHFVAFSILFPFLIMFVELQIVIFTGICGLYFIVYI